MPVTRPTEALQQTMPRCCVPCWRQVERSGAVLHASLFPVQPWLDVPDLGFAALVCADLARFRGRDKKQQHHALGEALEFDQAKRRAEDWLAQLTGSPVRAIKRGTVIAGLESYLTDLRRHGRAEAAKKAEGQFKTALGFERKDKRYKDPLTALQLEGATKDDFLDWRDRLRPARLPRSVNRFVRAVTAGLNRAHGLGHIGNPAAWRIEALADDA